MEINSTCIFFNVGEVATALHVSKSHIYSLIRRGEIPSKQVGKRILVPKCFVETLLK